MVGLYPNQSTTKLDRNAPRACPAKGMEFMAAAVEDGRAYAFVLALYVPNRFKKEGKAWSEPKDPVSLSTKS